MNNKKILIFGAGAIGRGFIAPLFYKKNYRISFVDNNSKLIEELNKKKTYIAAVIKKKKYNFTNIKIDKAFNISEKFDLKNYDLVFSCVGPKQCYEIAHLFKNAKNVISCENDRNSAEIIKQVSGVKNVYFAIPDVITSNSAPEYLKKKDNLCTVSEKGILVIEKNPLNFHNVAKKLPNKEFNMHWYCKFFIHNAPHAMLAYLGSLKKYDFIHEAMNDIYIKQIIIGAMNEITYGLIKSTLVDKDLANIYKKKEISRFKNKLLYDPISRVAREPLRKLAHDNRIVMATRLSFLNKNLPINTLIGFKSSFYYYDRNDTESHYLQKLRKASSEEELIKKLCNINETDPISLLIKKINLNKVYGKKK